MIPKGRLKEWLQDEITVAKRKGVQHKIRELEDELGGGATVTGYSDSTAIATARLVGRIDGLKDSLVIDEEEVIEEDA